MFWDGSECPLTWAITRFRPSELTKHYPRCSLTLFLIYAMALLFIISQSWNNLAISILTF